MTVLAVNAMILEGGQLSGIGYYIVQLLTHFSHFNEQCATPHRIKVLCRAEAAHHLDAISGIEVIPMVGGRGRLARVLTEQFRLPLRLQRERVDVLLNPAFTGPMLGAKRIVTTVHDLYFRVVPELVPRAQRLFLSLLVPLCCRVSMRVIAPSRATMGDLVHYYPRLAKKVSVVPLASRFPGPGKGEGQKAEPFVLMVAALTSNKNPEPLVGAIAALQARYPELRLVHIGRDAEGLLADAVARYRAEALVTSRSGISDSELEAAYAACLCVVMPSLYEGFGLPLLEAQALGAPVVSSNRASLPEVGGAGAIYVDPTSQEEIASAIADLIDMPAYREELRQLGFANQARFSWERTAKLTWDILTSSELK